MALDKVTTKVIADDAVTGAKIENNPTVAGNLTVAGTSTLTGNATASGNLTVTGDVIPSAPLSHRNMIYNGGMQIAQRRATPAVGLNASNSGYWTCDRWGITFYNTDNLVITSEQSSVSPDGFGSSIKHTATTAESALADDEYFRLWQTIEGQDLQQLAYGSSGAKSFTLSFWVRSSVAGTYGVTCYQYDGSLQQTHNYTITTANTWQKIELTFTGNTANAIANDNTEGLKFLWYLLVGNNFNGTASTTWSAYSGAKSAGLATADWGETTNDEFYLTGVQMELGSSATPFEHRSYGEELARCQRYYFLQVSGSGKNMGGLGWYYSSSEVQWVCSFPVTMRTSPTLDYNQGSYYAAGGDGFTQINIQHPGPNSTNNYNNNEMSGTQHNNHRMETNHASAKVAYVAELG